MTPLIIGLDHRTHTPLVAGSLLVRFVRYRHATANKETIITSAVNKKHLAYILESGKLHQQ